MRVSNRWLWLGLCAAVAVVLLLGAIAPTGGGGSSGSTLSRTPDGYGAWYADMQAQGISIQRWQKSPDLLWESATAPAEPMVLLRVVPPGNLEGTISRDWSDWVARGNTLVVLKSWKSAAAESFSTLQESDRGPVRIETRRRQPQRFLDPEQNQLLGDRYGAIVWETPIGSGKTIEATTPFLGANAYQDAPGNFAFLADLVTVPDAAIWVDEYLHGYEDTVPDNVAVRSSPQTWLTYLSATLWLPIAAQGAILAAVALWGQRRLGTPVSPQQPALDNSEAYIAALAGVLQQAKSREFVAETVARAERQRLQNALGLGSLSADDRAIAAAWVRQTGRPAEDLKPLLGAAELASASDRDLARWLKTIANLDPDRRP